MTIPVALRNSGAYGRGVEMTELTETFETSSAAWAFFEECEKKGWTAGYPSLKAPYTVRYIKASPAEVLKETK